MGREAGWRWESGGLSLQSRHLLCPERGGEKKTKSVKWKFQGGCVEAPRLESPAAQAGEEPRSGSRQCPPRPGPAGATPGAVGAAREGGSGAGKGGSAPRHLPAGRRRSLGPWEESLSCSVSFRTCWGPSRWRVRPGGAANEWERSLLSIYLCWERLGGGGREGVPGVLLQLWKLLKGRTETFLSQWEVCKWRWVKS